MNSMLEATWIVRNKEAIPWECLMGARVITSDGNEGLINHVQVRPWPYGPLLKVRYPGESEEEAHSYNIKGFESGKLEKIIPSAICLQSILEAVKRDEDLKKLRDDEAERKRALQVARNKEKDLERQRQAEMRAKLDLAQEKRKEKEQREAAESRARAHAASERMEAEAERERLRELDAARQFDLLLFDLDNTLLETTHLERYRGRENVGNIREVYINSLKTEAEQLSYLIPQSLLEKIRYTFPNLRLGIFTRAPLSYTSTILRMCYPVIEWDCLVTYESVNRTKPMPEGIFKAAKELQVSDLSRIAFVGDNESDILAAYQAGIFSVLYCKGWGSQWKSSPKRSEHYVTLKLHPDYIALEPKCIFNLITNPCAGLLSLEAWDAYGDDQDVSPSMRLDTHYHFNNVDQTLGHSDFITAKVMGRYFVSHHFNARYDFRMKEAGHHLSEVIIACKDGEYEYPQSWLECCSKHILSELESATGMFTSLLVCPIPARPGRPNRIERLIDRISKHIGHHDHLSFGLNVLRFKEGVKSNKLLSNRDRFINIRDHLEVANSSSFKNKRVLVFDDVSTSGATFYYASKYLGEAGASSVQCISLAQSIS